MTAIWITAFWGAMGVLVHTYVGYPLMIWSLARWGPKPKPADPPAPMPSKCSVVISAYNEESTLPGKVAHLLASPNARYIDEMWIGSDGSTDGTVAAVEALQDPRIHVVAYAARQGKPSVLNQLIPQCRNEVVVLMDARQELAADAIEALLGHFVDEQVGVVSGELIFRSIESDSVTASGMNVYWRYEKLIRRSEAAFRSVPGATGALYALRRSGFQPIPADLLLDDVAIPMQVVMQGKRCLFERQAIVYDVPNVQGRAEEIRKRRTIAGNLQLIRYYPQWLLPWRNPIWFEFVSHKMLRLLSPWALLLALASAVVLFGHSAFWNWMLAAQIGCYGLALVGRWVPVRFRLVTAAAMFLELNRVTVWAWMDAVRGRYRVDWQRPTS